MNATRELRVGVNALPPWSRVEAAFRGIFERHYFANGGPLVRELDAAFAQLLGAEHSVSVTNDAVALMILLKALDISGEVIVPALAAPAVPQAVWWAGLTPVVCDVDPGTFMVSPQTVAPHVNARTAAILGVRVFGRADGSAALEAFAAERGLKLIFDAASAIRCSHDGRRVGTFGAAEAFSFHSSHAINAGEGGSIVTNDAQLASKLRTIRTFFVPAEPVPLRINGKMAEAPAALALLAIEGLTDLVEANRHRRERYAQRLAAIGEISLVPASGGDENNAESVAIRIDDPRPGRSASELVRALAAQSIFAERPFGSGIHRRANCGIENVARDAFPVADDLCAQLVLLPNGADLTPDDIDRVCAAIGDVLVRGA